MADRYTYLPYVGLFFALAWWMDEKPAPGSAARAMKSALAGALLLLVPISLVQTWMRCQVWRDSDTLWTDVIRQYPGQVFDAYNNRGQYYQELGRDEEALRDFEQAFLLDPSSGHVYLQKGMILARRDHPDSALATFDRAIQLEPDLFDAWNNRGAMRIQKGDIAGALSDLDEAIRLNPRLRGAYANRGIAYNLAGDPERSIADYRLAIELEPEHPSNYQLWGAIGGTLEMLKRPREAVEALDQAIRLAPPAAPQRGSYLLYRSRAWLALGDRNSAARDSAEANRLGAAITSPR
jgi:tetratricopeptide (TPR) repeat protein